MSLSNLPESIKQKDTDQVFIDKHSKYLLKYISNVEESNDSANNYFKKVKGLIDSNKNRNTSLPELCNNSVATKNMELKSQDTITNYIRSIICADKSKDGDQMSAHDIVYNNEISKTIDNKNFNCDYRVSQCLNLFIKDHFKDNTELISTCTDGSNMHSVNAHTVESKRGKIHLPGIKQKNREEQGDIIKNYLTSNMLKQKCNNFRKEVQQSTQEMLKSKKLNGKYNKLNTEKIHQPNSFLASLDKLKEKSAKSISITQPLNVHSKKPKDMFDNTNTVEKVANNSNYAISLPLNSSFYKSQLWNKLNINKISSSMLNTNINELIGSSKVSNMQGKNKSSIHWFKIKTILKICILFNCIKQRSKSIKNDDFILDKNSAKDVANNSILRDIPLLEGKTGITFTYSPSIDNTNFKNNVSSPHDSFNYVSKQGSVRLKKLC